MKNATRFLNTVIPMSGLIWILFFGIDLKSCIGLVLIFGVIIPLVDKLTDSTLHSEPSLTSTASSTDHIYLYIFALVQAFLIILIFVKHIPVFEVTPLITLVTLAIASMIPSACYGHELLHCRKKFSKFFSSVCHVVIGQYHQNYYHLAIHHKDILKFKERTPRKGESYYSYVLNYPFRMYRETVKMLLHNRKYTDIIIVTSANLIVPLILLIYNYNIGLSYLFFTFICGLIFENFNYVTHYGVSQNTPHSWEESYYLSNILLLNLPRHHDHHDNANKQFINLNTGNGLVLPFALSFMMLLSLFPLLFFSQMNPLIEAQTRKSNFDAEINPC